MTPKSTLLCAAFAVGMMAFATPSFAQTAEADGTAALLSTSSTSTTTIVGGVILTIVLSSGNSSLQQYLRKNQVALRDDITLGAGETVADLADAFRVEDDRLDEFGAMLRSNRSTLLALIGDDVNAEKAQRFVELILQYGEREDIVVRARIANG